MKANVDKAQAYKFNVKIHSYFAHTHHGNFDGMLIEIERGLWQRGLDNFGGLVQCASASLRRSLLLIQLTCAMCQTFDFIQLILFLQHQYNL